MSPRSMNDSKNWVTEPTCESLKTVSDKDDEASIATPASVLGWKTLVNATSHHLFAWCVSCTKIIFIQCAPNIPLPYMKELAGSSNGSQPLSGLIAVSCRSCAESLIQKGNRINNLTTLSLSPEWVCNTYMYHNLRKLTLRPITVVEKDGGIIAVPMDRLSQALQKETGKYQILGLDSSVACSQSASADAMLAPYVSSSFV